MIQFAAIIGVVLGGENHILGKEDTTGIEGNNCRLRHRVSRAFRRSCCFSKKLLNHFESISSHQLWICFNSILCKILPKIFPYILIVIFLKKLQKN